MVKKKCPKCGSLMPYIAGKGYTCLNCGYIQENSIHDEIKHMSAY